MDNSKSEHPQKTTLAKLIQAIIDKSDNHEKLNDAFQSNYPEYSQEVCQTLFEEADKILHNYLSQHQKQIMSLFMVENEKHLMEKSVEFVDQSVSNAIYLDQIAAQTDLICAGILYIVGRQAMALPLFIEGLHKYKHKEHFNILELF